MAPSLSEWESFCATQGGLTVTAASHPGSGGSYTYGSRNDYPAAESFYGSVVLNRLDSSALGSFYNNVVIMHASSSTCWAHNAEAGSMWAFGGPSGTGYSYCRMSASGGTCSSNSNPHGSCVPEVKYRVYLCRGATAINCG